MSPRTYKMDRRQVAAAETRARILKSARALLVAPDFREFTMEAVAKAADVSRLTVYYQFDSKAGLLEALYDDLARNGYLGTLPDVFRYGNVALDKLHRFVEVFVRFWASDRAVIRRLHALGVIDPEIGQGLRVRNERRRNGLRVLVEQYCLDTWRYAAMQGPHMLDILHMLTSFETFDALAGTDRATDEVLKIIRKMADQALGMSPQPVSPYTAPPLELPRETRRSRSRKRR